MKFSNQQERLETLNKNADKTPLIDILDRPIKPLVLEMNRIGLKTRFSCCGFNYRNEEEPKSHSKWPFVLFEQPKYKDLEKNVYLDILIIDNFFNFCKMAKKIGWLMILQNPVEKEWGVTFQQNNECGWTTNDGLPDTIHDHENKINAIKNLTDYTAHLPTRYDEFILQDGNKDRCETYSEWLVKPKKEIKIKVIKENNNYLYVPIN